MEEHSNAAGPPLRVAIIDDEPAIRMLVRMLLDDQPDRFQLVAEADHLAYGLEAVDAQQPDVILLDLLLPGSRGGTSLGRVAAAAPNAMILVLSALPGTDEADEAFSAGAFAYLEKSLLGPPLLEEVAELYDLFCQHRAGVDVWGEPDGPSRTRS